MPLPRWDELGCSQVISSSEGVGRRRDLCLSQSLVPGRSCHGQGVMGQGGTLCPAHHAHLDSPTRVLTPRFSSSRLEDVVHSQFCKWDLGETSVHRVVGARWSDGGWSLQFCHLLTFLPHHGWQRAGVAIKFLLHKSVPEYGVVFEEVSEQELQLGDIVLFAFQLSNQNLSSIFGHAGVYCWDGEVIHFQSKCLTPCSPLGRGGGQMVARDSVTGSG